MNIYFLNSEIIEFKPNLIFLSHEGIKKEHVMKHALKFIH